MSVPDYIIFGGIILAAAGIIASMVRKRRRGKTCRGNCAQCVNCNMK